MKLVFTRKDSPNGCVRVGWPDDDEDISWISLFYSPTDEEIQTGWVEDLADPTPDFIFDEFAKLAVRPEDRVYTVLEIERNIESDYKVVLQELRGSGLTIATKDELNKRKGLLRRLFSLEDPSKRSVYVSGVSRSQMEAWNREYGYQFLMFLISDHPLDDWVRELLAAQSMRLDKPFLRRVGRLIVNHWRHGVELIGMHLDVEPFESVAKELSHRLRLPLEIREKRNWPPTESLSSSLKAL